MTTKIWEVLKFCLAFILGCGANQIQINDECYDLVELGAKCRFSRQCPMTSYCVSQKCQCTAGFEAKNGRCVEIKEKPVIASTSVPPTTKIPKSNHWELISVQFVLKHWGVVYLISCWPINLHYNQC